jgi:hypothetical protein
MRTVWFENTIGRGLTAISDDIKEALEIAREGDSERDIEIRSLLEQADKNIDTLRVNANLPNF